MLFVLLTLRFCVKNFETSIFAPIQESNLVIFWDKPRWKRASLNRISKYTNTFYFLNFIRNIKEEKKKKMAVISDSFQELVGIKFRDWAFMHFTSIFNNNFNSTFI